MLHAGDVHYEKGFIWSVYPHGPLNMGFTGSVEMFSELCRLQSEVFFSIGHSFAAVAFVVSGSRKLEQIQVSQHAAAHRCFASPRARTA
jgi:hypothetical protein